MSLRAGTGGGGGSGALSGSNEVDPLLVPANGSTSTCYSKRTGYTYPLSSTDP
jgi:hypothetical protein